MKTLYLIRGHQQKSIAATVSFEGENVLWQTENDELAILLARFFGRDFDEHLGFPAQRRRAKKGSPEALQFAATYLATVMGYQLVLSQSISRPIPQPAARLTRRTSYSVFLGLLVTRQIFLDRFLDSNLATREKVDQHGYTEALKYGCREEFMRLRRMIEHRDSSRSVTAATDSPAGSWFRLRPNASTGTRRPRLDADLTAGVIATMGSGSIRTGASLAA